MKILTWFFIVCMALFFPAFESGADGVWGKVDLSNAVITSSHADIGTVQNCFDGDSTTLMRSDVNPAWIQIEFPSVTGIAGIRVLLGEIGYTNIDQDDFWVDAANSIPDMDNKTGSYDNIVPIQANVAGHWYSWSFPEIVSKKIWKIWVKRTFVDNYVHIPEIELYGVTDTIHGLPATLQLFEGWRWRNLPNLQFNDNDTIITNRQLSWTSSDPEVAYVDSSGVVVALSKGETIITAAYKDISSTEMKVTVKRALRPVKHNRSEPFLSAPADNALFEVPVLIISFIPTDDNVNVDEAYSYQFCNKTTVENMEHTILSYNKRLKFAIEQGSRFRNYKDSSSVPSIGYRVLDYITIYEPMPPAGILYGYDNGTLEYSCDYEQIFNRLDVKDYVENQGVKEIWIWANGVNGTIPCFDPAIHFPENFRASSESNMASPVTGDISNSPRIPDDLPIYKSGYIVIHQSPNRNQSINMEPHTHQFENMFTCINVKQDGNSNLFWNDFVGKIGRCGWTHTPPNTEINYGYMSYIQHDTTLVKPVLSDIEDWKPDNSGVKTLVSYHNWEDKIYDWPDSLTEFDGRNELQWFIYWLQSIPGYNNNIPYGCDKVITNWWEFIARWDSCNLNGTGLYETRPAGIIHVTACGSYTSPGGKYIWNKSGSYIDTIQSTSGCDSIITIELSITTADTTVTRSDNGLLSNSAGSVYRWLDCESNYSEIADATDRGFIPSANGTYAVEITKNGCVDTSACYAVTNVPVFDLGSDTSLKVYPNPTNRKVCAELGQIYRDVKIVVKSITGQVISTANFGSTNIINFKLPDVNGLYILEISADAGEIAKIKLIKY